MSRGPVRVLHVIPASNLGGAQQVCATLLEGIDRQRFDVWVACHGQGPMFADYRQHSRGAVALDLLNVLDVRAVVRLARLMRRLRIEIVHTHLWQGDMLGGWAAALARVPVRVSTVHGEYFSAAALPGGRASGGALRGGYRAMCRLFDKTVAVSRHVATALVSAPTFPRPPGAVVQIYNGINLARADAAARSPDRQRLGQPDGVPMITVVANFFLIKGHRFLIDAMPRVLDRFGNALLVLIGDGPLLASLRARVDTAGLAPSIRFLGARRDALEFMAASDVVVLPSLMEGCPLVPLEAGAVGIAVVATRVGGTPEVVDDGRSGLLVSSRDTGALADAIVSVLADRDLGRALGDRGRELVRARFGADGMVRGVESLYAELAERLVR